MIDIVFLLLTFFIYSMAMMIRASVLPVQLTPLASGKPAAGGGDVQAITVDKNGKMFLDRTPVTFDQLDEQLAKMACRTPSVPGSLWRWRPPATPTAARC